MEFRYLTKEEQEMPIDMALLQIALGLQGCKTKGDVVDLLEDAVMLGRKETIEFVEKVMLGFPLSENWDWDRWAEFKKQEGKDAVKD